MNSPASAVLFGLAALCSAAVEAKPVPAGETPAHTKFFIDDATLSQVALADGPALQALIITRNAPDPQIKSGQIGAASMMQFRCRRKSYRQWSTDALHKDGTRVRVVSPDPARSFSATREGSFERRLLDAACAMKVRKP
ncbi:MAG: hypothetical protein JSR28_12995 [Proteobacteria bacterium]|nr:hypothetical protein [Pseudomonadota bacterium]MDE2412358.1 hypothetical protein [Sphingomonadales bacterium]